MKTIIAGSREIEDYSLVEAAVAQSGFTITEVVSGTARGVDRLGEEWAARHGVPVKRFPANWDAYKKEAGFIRNEEMGLYAEALVAVTNGSRGTQHMIDYATKRGLKVFIFEDPTPSLIAAFNASPEAKKSLLNANIHIRRSSDFE